jgi:hypothetical protein
MNRIKYNSLSIEQKRNICTYHEKNKGIMKSFKQIKLYCEHQKQTQSDHLDVINQLEDIIMNFVHLNMRQKPIDSYLIKN